MPCLIGFQEVKKERGDEHKKEVAVESDTPTLSVEAKHHPKYLKALRIHKHSLFLSPPILNF
jgi:hypothetical protein